MTTRKRKHRLPPPESYQERTYRRAVATGDLVSFEVQVRETDLHILASTDLRETAANLVFRYRSQLESYIASHPAFLTSLTPLAVDPMAVPIVKAMQRAAEPAGVGPMAAVAGAVAEFVGRDLMAAGAAEVVVENGGDIFLQRTEECVVGIFAGTSPLSGRVGIRLSPERMPLGICTSSGRVGHSLSLGRADAVTVVAASTCLADAVATRLGNEVKENRDIDRALAVAKSIAGLAGVVIIKDGHLGAWGEVELVRLG
ncbi:MAG: UPF0280 family protein [Desulfobulbaceae bacterium]|nr:UPF0280 family protein [Desulfobulbaceae bacterium]